MEQAESNLDEKIFRSVTRAFKEREEENKRAAEKFAAEAVEQFNKDQVMHVTRPHWYQAESFITAGKFLTTAGFLVWGYGLLTGGYLLLI